MTVNVNRTVTPTVRDNNTFPAAVYAAKTPDETLAELHSDMLGLDEIDACIARTGVMADEIAQVMQESLARRTYTMSLMAMVFLPSTFLTGLFGVNLGGIPGGGWQFGFSLFCILLVVLIGGVTLWLHRSKWL